jgi:diguanylate cyclase (GGDEF)-like protein
VDGEALLLKLATFLQCKREVDSLRDESLLDAGTGLYNMRGLARRAHEIGSDAFRRRDPLACIVFTPEVESEAAGESSEEESQRIAEQVGHLLKRVGRSSDAIGRLGDSEFAVIAPATGTEGALRLVRRLGGTIEASPIPVRGGERNLRVQAGYCAVPDFAESPVDAVELLLRATTALRDLKRGGDAERVRGFDQTPLSYPT